MDFVNLNGVLLPAAEARVSTMDHGLLYGDGLFETIRVAERRLFRPAAHLARLRSGAGQIMLRIPRSDAELIAALDSVVSANSIINGVVRLTVTRGAGPPIPDPEQCPEPGFFVTARPVTVGDNADRMRGVTLCVGGAHPRLFVPGVKSLCYLPFQIARQEARRRGFDDALLTWGNLVVESTSSNIFAVLEGELITPDLTSGCLPGVTRRLILELARDQGLTVREAALSRDTIAEAEELFLTNAVTGPRPVTMLDGEQIGKGQVGAITLRLSLAYEALLPEAPIPFT